MATGRKPFGPKKRQLCRCLKFLEWYFPEADLIKMPGSGDYPAVEARGIVFGVIRGKEP